MMRIGIVCEGPTDFYAIREFFSAALDASGVLSEFVSIQPNMDNTRPSGGWTNVISWLQKNPPEARAIRFFGSGLFATSSDSCDALLIQMDTDILDDPLFQDFSRNKLGYQVTVSHEVQKRADEIREVLRQAARFGEMTERDRGKHVLAPAVESTENWCVAAFKVPTKDFETLSGQELCDAFMIAIQRFEGIDPIPPYSNIDKSIPRRERFCSEYANFHGRIAQGCKQFRIARDELISIGAQM